MDSHNLYSTSEFSPTWEVSTLPTKQPWAQRKLQIHLLSRNCKEIRHAHSPSFHYAKKVKQLSSIIQARKHHVSNQPALSATAQGAFFRTGEATKMPSTSCSSGTFSWEDHEIQHHLKGSLEWWVAILGKPFYCSVIMIISRVSSALNVDVSMHTHACSMHTCSYQRVHVSEGQRLTSGVLPNFSQPYLFRQGLLRNLDLINLGRLTKQ